MTNADKFREVFGLYATELWAKPYSEFSKWLNEDVHETNVGDTISRQEAIDAVSELVSSKSVCVSIDECNGMKSMQRRAVMAIKDLPSAQPNVPDRNVGEWDMFELITSTWYGKQCYFREDNGIIYSRVSCKYMSVDDAIKEFLWRIGDNG